MTDELSFGTWLKKQRRISDLTRQALANQVGCAEITLRRIENGSLKPSKELAKLLLQKFNIPIEEQAGWVAFARGLSGPPSIQLAPALQQPVSNLPVFLTSFLGREKEQTEIIKGLRKYRLVTLTGPGGVGKTRLAVKVGGQILSRYPDGVWLAELAALNDPVLLPRTILGLLGVISYPNSIPTELLINFLRTKNSLLILDNCEHLIEACAQLVDTLLRHCPNLGILSTSREPLGLDGEAIYQVPSLRIPDPEHLPESGREYEAMSLFEERAQLAQMNFTLTSENLVAVAQICRRLDGIPLAIELAAARVGMFSPAQIAAQLTESFNLLTGGSRTALPRQKTIRASIDWSWNLLTDAERSLLRRLSVFLGGWTLEDATAICSGADIQAQQILTLTGQLAAKSLLVANPEAGRWHLLEIIRQHAHEKLIEAREESEIRNRHLEHFLNMVRQAEPQLQRAQQIFWLNRLQVEHDNLRQALDWSLGPGNFEAGAQLAGGLTIFWDIRGYNSEGCLWLGRFLTRLGNLTLQTQARLLFSSAYLSQRQGKLTEAQSAYQTSLTIYKRLEDEAQIASIWKNMGDLAQDEGDFTNANALYKKSLDLFRSLNDALGISMALGGLSVIAMLDGEYEQSIQLSTESLEFGHQQQGNSWVAAAAFTTIGFASWGMNNTQQAIESFTKALTLTRALEEKWVSQHILMGMALVALSLNKLEYATRVFAASDGLREMIGTPISINQRMQLDAFMAALRAMLDEAAFLTAYTEGRSMSLDQAIQYALDGIN